MLQSIIDVYNYSKEKRIKRLIEISVKGDDATVLEKFELAAIQSIRSANGEIDEVRKDRQDE